MRVHDGVRGARRDVRRAVRERRAAERDDIRRFTAHVRRRRQVVALSIGAVVALGAFVAIGTFTPVMALTTITVVGTQRVDATLISKGVANQLGKPLPLVDTGAIEKVIARQPLVESFAIESRPPHEMVIHITERAPVGYLKTDDEFTLVDAAGVAIERTAGREQALPLFEVKGNSATAEGFAASVRVLRSLPADLRSQIDRVAATTTDDVTLFLAPTQSRVLWGSPEQSSLKARVLAALLANFPPGSVSQYDVSAPGSAVVS